MQKRQLGRTGLDVSLLTFGCGAVGGLMTRGDAADQDRAVAWARDNGINHFDTAPLYGNCASETNLGRALGNNRDDIFVSTKVMLAEEDFANLAGAIRKSLEDSLKRLQQDHVDVYQLHNELGGTVAGSMTSGQIIDEVVPAFIKLRDEGKIRFLGFTAAGDTDAAHTLVQSGHFDTSQIFYNLLIPSAGETIPAGYPGQDYRRLLNAARDHDMGSIVVRILAGGALSGSEARHPLGMETVDPMGSGEDYATDVRRALKFSDLIEAGHATNLAELAVRYVISNPVLSTTEIGIATLDELQKAADAVNKGPLSDDALAQIKSIQAAFAGES